MPSPLYRSVAERLQALNARGEPAFFAVAGHKSSGKTTVARHLLRSFEFYQMVNLGVVSKMMHFFKDNWRAGKRGGVDDPEDIKLFHDIVDFMMTHYRRSGVNTVFEGSLIDPSRFSANPHVLGGVVLRVTRDLAIERGQRPPSHFNRIVDRVEPRPYEAHPGFIEISNDGPLDETLDAVVRQLDELLAQRLAV
jgi:hypothetical protein